MDRSPARILLTLIWVIVWVIAGSAAINPVEAQTGFDRPVSTLVGASRLRPNFVFLVAEDVSKHHFNLFDENGTETPNIRALAEQGLIYKHAFSNSPVCSVARTTLMTGYYAPMLGAHHHRTEHKLRLPDRIKFFPSRLRDAGYYTTNRKKTDYNVTSRHQIWDESSGEATWRNRKKDQPFFHMQTFTTTHEGRLHFPETDLVDKPIEGLQNVFVQPRHPDTELFRYTRARLHKSVRQMDKQLGEVIRLLRDDGLLDSTFIFFFGDHGGVLPGSKGYLYETGLHVPLVIRIPEQYRESCPTVGTTIKQFVSFVDFSPTLLNLAGEMVPRSRCGRPFLGPGVEHNESRDLTFGYADRFDERTGMVRSVRYRNLKYIRNFRPWYSDGLQNNYRYKMAAYRQWRNLFRDGKLNDTQAGFFRPGPAEQLFDLQKDPYETNNLVTVPSRQQSLAKLKKNLWQKQMVCMDPALFDGGDQTTIHQPDEQMADWYERSFPGKRRIMALRQLGDFSGDVEPSLIAKIFDFVPSDSDVPDDQEQSELTPFLQKALVCRAIERCIVKRSVEYEDQIGELYNRWDSRLVKLRVIEYLAIVNGQDPGPRVLRLLNSTNDAGHTVEILNSIVGLRDGPMVYQIPVTVESVHPEVRQDKNVMRRLEYLAE